MTDAKFRIESVSIEGFKAFTTKQIFRFNGRHVFLFGPNGSGKTSIVEAVRWCLFGLASRRGEIVKNQFYAGGPCVVQITLSAPDGSWTLQRRLRQSGGESDLTVRDPSGTERNLEDVFPQLSRIGPSEGTHVIYAAQQPSSRRPEADITDFRNVVYRYLGLEEVPRLSDVLLGLSKGWQIEESEICGLADTLGEDMSRRISDIDDSLSRINAASPWGSGLTPSNAATNRKIAELAVDAANLGADISSQEIANLDLDVKLYEIGAAIDRYLSGGMVVLKQELTERINRKNDAEGLLTQARSEAAVVDEKTDELAELESKLATTLNGYKLQDLIEQLRVIDKDLETTQLELDVVQAMSRFLGAIDQTNSSVNCPACAVAVELEPLKSEIAGLRIAGDQRSKEILGQRDMLRKRVSSGQNLDSRISQLGSEIRQHRIDLAEVLEHAVNEFELAFEPSVESLAGFVDDMRNGCQELQAAVDSRGEAIGTWETRIENLRQEVQFQNLRALKGRLENLFNGRYASLCERLKDLTDMRNVADETRMMLNAQLQERLNTDLPPVAQEMTDVYLRLTETPTFDSINIEQGENAEGGTTLDLRVSSSRGPGNWGVEHGILNGQALNAIQLVPYFVFSRYQEGPLLDLLLLDDPTQAFDTKKIKLLLGELREAASHATLFVATHEEDRFVPVLKELFEGTEVNAYRALGIDEDGPKFEDVPINH